LKKKGSIACVQREIDWNNSKELIAVISIKVLGFIEPLRRIATRGGVWMLPAEGPESPHEHSCPCHRCETLQVGMATDIDGILVNLETLLSLCALTSR
jgi:hypothetical protein